jgi:hypothetical protein
MEKIKTHNFVFNTFFLHRVVYEIVWKNMAEADRPQMKIQYGAENMQE